MQLFIFVLAIWVGRPMLYTHIAVGPYVVFQAVRKMEDDTEMFRCFGEVGSNSGYCVSVNRSCNCFFKLYISEFHWAAVVLNVI